MPSLGSFPDSKMSSLKYWFPYSHIFKTSARRGRVPLVDRFLIYRLTSFRGNILGRASRSRKKIVLGALAVLACLTISGCGSSQGSDSVNQIDAATQVEGQSVLDMLNSGDPASNWHIDSFNNGGSSKAVQVILGDPDCAVWLYSNSSDSTYERSAVLYYTPTFSNTSVGGYYAVIAGPSPFSSCVAGAMRALGVNQNSTGSQANTKPYWQPTEKNIVECYQDGEYNDGSCSSTTYDFRDESSYGLSAGVLGDKLVEAGVCTEVLGYSDSKYGACIPSAPGANGGEMKILTIDRQIATECYFSCGENLTGPYYVVIGEGWVAVWEYFLNPEGDDMAYLPNMRNRIADVLGGHVYKINR